MTPEEEICAAVDEFVQPHLRDGVLGHILSGRPTGDFLAAVFTNDLAQAVTRADPQSLAGLPALMRFLHNDAPAACWGTPATAQAWRDRGGLHGVPALAEAYQ